MNNVKIENIFLNQGPRMQKDKEKKKKKESNKNWSNQILNDGKRLNANPTTSAYVKSNHLKNVGFISCTTCSNLFLYVQVALPIVLVSPSNTRISYPTFIPVLPFSNFASNFELQGSIYISR